ncbi:hypothetical protein PPTG_16436 [Phytophthora nicotianae INRA-310]|uniref:RxLR effector protein n=1 Tax=Phytophthora nicotianae (strain INRA-310) TaxID=761204 RepID=W2PNB4_PHYN3|nr:hypothetical protein PPTG_16436 [Phytophthora nicotianae INRA-310]ETN02483.1 hypothetical protein PPTG_16436 [Phytophthora nicotianae INRA-310]
MRSLRFLLAITASILFSQALSAAADSTARTVSASPNNKLERRFLRDGEAAEPHTGENTEERAIISFGRDIVSNKADTKKLLQDLLKENMPVRQFKEEFLNIPSTITSFDELVKHQNWKALVKYQRMKFEKDHGVKLPYAILDKKQLSKEQTQEQLLKWLLEKRPVKTVGENLGVWSVPNSYPILHQNWRAFKMYEKLFAELQHIQTDPKRYAQFIRTEEKAKEKLVDLVIAKTPFKDILQTFELTGLSASTMAKHQNFPALLAFVKLKAEYKAVEKAWAAANPHIRRNT